MSIFSVQGTTFTFNGTAVGGITGYSGFDGEAPDIDETTFDDTEFRVFTQGLADAGQFSIDVFRDPDNAGQAAMEAASTGGVTGECVLTFLGWGTVTFDAYVKSMPIAGGIDARVTGSIPLKITGEPVWEED